MLNIAKVQGNTSDSLLKHLEEHSEYLQEKNSQFISISGSFEIIFAYETKPTPVAGAVAREVSLLVSDIDGPSSDIATPLDCTQMVSCCSWYPQRGRDRS